MLRRGAHLPAVVVEGFCRGLSSHHHPRCRLAPSRLLSGAAVIGTAWRLQPRCRAPWAPLPWVTFGLLLALSGSQKVHKLTRVLVLLHYTAGLALVATTSGERAHLQFGLRMSPESMIVWATIYLGWAGRVVAADRRARPIDPAVSPARAVAAGVRGPGHLP